MTIGLTTGPRDDSAREHSYSGPDRRHPIPVTNVTTRQYLASIITIAAVAAGWSALAILAAERSPQASFALVDMTHALCSALLLASAALMFAVWRITGTARSAWGATALALVGLAIPMVTMIGTITAPSAHASTTAAVARAVIKLLVIAAAAAALRSREIDARIRPARLVMPFAGLGAGLIAGLIISGAQQGATAAGAVDRSTTRSIAIIALQVGVVVAALLVAACFTWVGLRGWRATRKTSQNPARTRRRHRARMNIAIAAGMTFFAAGALGRAVSGALTADRALIIAGVTLMMVCVIAAICALALWRLHTGQGTRMLAVSGRLRDTTTDLVTTRSDLTATASTLTETRSDHARRLHDARNAIFAIAGATDLLASPTRPETVDTARLKGLVITELDRLDQLLDPHQVAAGLTTSTIADTATDETATATTASVDTVTGPCRAADVLNPIITGCRLRGMSITADLADVLIPDPSAPIKNIMTNLLTNARVHAPGAHVWVTARGIGAGESGSTNTAKYDAVRITVADDGPGIDPAQRTAVLAEGARGSSALSDGCGLGLASVARTLSDRGGTLHLSERKGGGTMVEMTLPTATTGTAPGNAERSDAAGTLR